MKRFAPFWCRWVQQFVSGGSVAVKVSGVIFKPEKAYGKVIHFHLFSLIFADMLAIFITRAKEDGQIQGLIPHLVDGGLSILQYADDTILFMEHDLEQAKNMKIILCAFEQLSGLKINFHKSELFFAMGRQRSTWNNIHKSLDVEWVIFLLDTWVYQ
jgi:hypothetical protein